LPGWSWARPAVAGGGVFTGTVGSVTYVGARAGTFVAVDRASGKIRWLYPAPAPEEGQWGFGASAAATEDLVFAADLGGRIYAFRARS
jgi:outer membrane protein assembly factor BamB